MLRKDDPAFKKVADDATAALYTSGEGQKIYDKWFTQKIPPKGSEPQRADRRGAEERVRQAVGFAGSGFVQVNVDLRAETPQAMAVSSRKWPEICMDVVSINANLVGVSA